MGGEQPGISAQGGNGLRERLQLQRMEWLGRGLGYPGFTTSVRDKQGALSLPGRLGAFVLFRGWSGAWGLNWLLLPRPGGKSQECKAASP